MQEQLELIAQEMLAPIFTRARVFTIINIILIVFIIGMIVVFIKQHREIEAFDKQLRQEGEQNEK